MNKLINTKNLLMFALFALFIYFLFTMITHIVAPAWMFGLNYIALKNFNIIIFVIYTILLSLITLKLYSKFKIHNLIVYLTIAIFLITFCVKDIYNYSTGILGLYNSGVAELEYNVKLLITYKLQLTAYILLLAVGVAINIILIIKELKKHKSIDKT